MYKQALCAMAWLLPQPHAQAVNSLGCTTISFCHHEIARPTRSSSFQRTPLHRGLDYTVNNIKHKQTQAQNQLLRARGPSQGQTIASAAGGLPWSIQRRLSRQQQSTACLLLYEHFARKSPCQHDVFVEIDAAGKPAKKSSRRGVRSSTPTAVTPQRDQPAVQYAIR